jgi:hypothetical protein
MIALLEEDTMPKDMKHLVTRELSETQMSGLIVSAKLAMELGDVVTVS